MSERQPEKEPVFSRQEQGVVYLFSRYWQRIPAFKDKQIYDIQMRFPDASMEDAKTGAVEAIEFEYALSSFNHYGRADWKTLAGYDSLYVVYWEPDIDKKDFCRRIKPHFPGKVECVCLKEYFRPFVKAGPSGLHASWIFRQTEGLGEAYSFAAIHEHTKTLRSSGALGRLVPNKGLYRTIGFDKRRADCIECGHWAQIHLFTTTTRFHKDMVPCQLLFRPSGCQYFWGYFDVGDAFVINEGGEPLEDYFRRYYFWPYDKWYKRSVCFVYRRFKPLTRQQGVALFNHLERDGVRLDIRGSRVIDDRRHIGHIDRIVG